VARDRKRAKQRRDRQARAGGAQARRADRAAAAPELATGEADLADAQLALGRPELTDARDADADPQADNGAGVAEIRDEGELERLEDDLEVVEERFEAGEDADAGAELAPRPTRAPQAPERSEGNRFANFLRGSWRELQRVQWPDRHQVSQATAVVIGFVIVAGAFLGVMDFVAAKLVDLII
jgi:preprotein translocase subunit SecE